MRARSLTFAVLCCAAVCACTQAEASLRTHCARAPPAQAPAPDASKIPKKDLLELTVVLLTGLYRNNEFIRVGYYVTNSLAPAAGALGENAPAAAQQQQQPPPLSLEQQAQLEKMSGPELARQLWRHIAADAPRVTRFPIDWDEPNPELIMPADVRCVCV